MFKKHTPHLVGGIAVVIACILIGYAAYLGIPAKSPAQSTHPIACTMEAKQCPDGSFVDRQGPNCEFAECPKSTMPSTIGTCIVGGCSRELCTESTGEPLMSPCIFRPELVCYKNATCERQSTGSCGWTQTPQLRTCLKNPPKDL